MKIRTNWFQRILSGNSTGNSKVDIQKELLELIKNTEALLTEEKENWTKLVTSKKMNEEQTEALYNILMDEKMLLEKEEKRHQEAIENLSKKHLTEWREFFSKKKKV